MSYYCGGKVLYRPLFIARSVPVMLIEYGYLNLSSSLLFALTRLYRKHRRRDHSKTRSQRGHRLIKCLFVGHGSSKACIVSQGL
jgi:hypothetical protein